MRIDGTGKVRRIESPVLAGQILTDEELDQIMGGKSIRKVRRGPARKGKRKLRRPSR